MLERKRHQLIALSVGALAVSAGVITYYIIENE
jgi:hypothetical protein